TTRSLDFLASTRERPRSLDFLTARSLLRRASRSLDLLTTRSLDFLTARSLDLLTSASQRARRLDVLPLRHALLGQHLLRLRHLGRARRLRVGHGHEGREERYAHDRCRRHQLLHRVFLPRVSGCCTETAAIPIETARSRLPVTVSGGSKASEMPHLSVSQITHKTRYLRRPTIARTRRCARAFERGGSGILPACCDTLRRPWPPRRASRSRCSSRF